jgi:hypothetical protein
MSQKKLIGFGEMGPGKKLGRRDEKNRLANFPLFGADFLRHQGMKIGARQAGAEDRFEAARSCDFHEKSPRKRYPHVTQP